MVPAASTAASPFSTPLPPHCSHRRKPQPAHHRQPLRGSTSHTRQRSWPRPKHTWQVMVWHTTKRAASATERSESAVCVAETPPDLKPCPLRSHTHLRQLRLWCLCACELHRLFAAALRPAARAGTTASCATSPPADCNRAQLRSGGAAALLALPSRQASHAAAAQGAGVQRHRAHPEPQRERTLTRAARLGGETGLCDAARKHTPAAIHTAEGLAQRNFECGWCVRCGRLIIGMTVALSPVLYRSRCSCKSCVCGHGEHLSFSTHSHGPALAAA